MINKTNTLQNFQVYVDGELQSPTHVEALQAAFKSKTTQVSANARMQVRIVLYDLTHRTKYRRIRNQLARERRNREFEKSIGICLIGK